MFFLFEAFFRRPTESHALVWFRGAIASLFIIGFLSYFTYLGVQIHNDTPLVQIFEKNMTDGVSVPAIEICGSNSDILIAHCDFQYFNGTVIIYTSCTSWLQPEMDNSNGSYCYVFSVNDEITFGTGNSDSDLQTINFYFKILNLTAAISQTISIPSISVNLFDNCRYEVYRRFFVPIFNPLKSSDAWTNADWQEWRDIASGKAATAAIQGFSTDISFTRSSYYAIRPEDVGAIIGLGPNYDIVPSVEMTMINYPLHPSQNFSDNGLSGHFGISPARETEDIQREQRTHTVLSGLAFAGGAWGGLFAVYTILFGHQRLMPWGIMHRITFFNSKDKPQWNSVSDNQFPLISSAGADGSYINEQDRAERIEARVLELESLLKDYFLDSAYLARLKHLQHSESRWSVVV